MLLIAALVLIGLAPSCKKDTPGPTPQERLIGKWQATKALLGATNALPHCKERP